MIVYLAIAAATFLATMWLGHNSSGGIPRVIALSVVAIIAGIIWPVAIPLKLWDDHLRRQEERKS